MKHDLPLLYITQHFTVESEKLFFFFNIHNTIKEKPTEFISGI